jgi:hypothetical protein
MNSHNPIILKEWAIWTAISHPTEIDFEREGISK